MTTVHLASVLRQAADGTWSCRDPSPTWCSPSPLSPVTTDRETCTCFACLRAEARAMAAVADATQAERDRLREAIHGAASVVQWVHSGAGQERAPRRILLAACEAMKRLPAAADGDLIERGAA